MVVYKIAIGPKKVVRRNSLVEARKYAMANHPKRGWAVTIWTGKIDEDEDQGDVIFVKGKFWWNVIGSVTLISPTGYLTDTNSTYMDLMDWKDGKIKKLPVW